MLGFRKNALGLREWKKEILVVVLMVPVIVKAMSNRLLSKLPYWVGKLVFGMEE